MKRYGFKFPTFDSYGSRYIEHRSLALLAALVLGPLFGENWLIALGLVFFVLGALAEEWGEQPLIIAAIVPISSFIWFVLTLIGFSEFFPASLLYSLVSGFLIIDALRAVPGDCE